MGLCVYADLLFILRLLFGVINDDNSTEYTASFVYLLLTSSKATQPKMHEYACKRVTPTLTSIWQLAPPHQLGDRGKLGGKAPPEIEFGAFSI